MCLILVGIAARPGSRMLLLANRDEFHARAAAPAAPWEDDPGVVGGRDLVAGGSWLAVRGDGRFAAVTNLRNGLPQPAPRSRGELVSRFVRGGEDAASWLDALRGHIDDYAPFNLVLGDAAGAFAFDGTTRTVRGLEPGLHAISNGPIDRDWPKMRRIRAAVADALAHGAGDDDLLALLRDPEPAPDAQLPDTGFGLERERQLSPIFIAGTDYGTRASTLVEQGGDGALRLVELGFGAGGRASGRSAWHHRRGEGWRPGREG
ncbi:MAG: NRDE family protein [Chiayiivirga sp.]|uniref:NRDE family protein n=1 Tax=Denitratimonas tolerans TaxID=1338420 RepID=A0AAW9R2P9_9GAMM|nr:NRDE family protein [Xanthomonadaceae bacterium]MDX9764623.1 NRDE family protein [Chiayiivirga sp.]MEB2316354.1 NRDE family protein [Xanthomonadaceae bacterium]HRO87085.1 NRDE family protein [Chiayiivirga sp.]HRQ35102.1 NRDE family protein [Chiayiivirga sp.]